MNTDAIESLRSFAVSHGELAFAHLCTAALSGEAWAVERIADTIDKVTRDTNYFVGYGLNRPALQEYSKLEIIRATDTTRPDGAVARGFVP